MVAVHARAPNIGTGLWLVLPAILCLALSSSPATAFEPSEVSAIVGNLKKPSDFPGHGGVWMARQRTVKIDGVGNAVITDHLLARVFDSAWGATRFTPFRRSFWSLFTSVMVSRAGVWRSRAEFTELPADSIGTETTPSASPDGSYRTMHDCVVSFPKLHPGEVVELRIVWTCQIAPWDPGVRWMEETFGAEDPVVEHQFVIQLPAAADLDTTVLGPPVRPRTYTRDGLRNTIWLTGGLPALKAPLLETPWARVPFPGDSVGSQVSRVVVGTLASWVYASTHFGGQWETQWNRRSAEQDQWVSSALAAATDAAGRARALDRMVRDRIKTVPISDLHLDMNPLTANLIMSERAGAPRDKSCLLVSLLRQAGIEASPVCVRLRSDGWDEQVPAVSDFDRWMVRASLPGQEDLWFDPGGPGGPLPPGRGLLLVGRSDRRELQAEAGLIDFPGIRAAQR